MAVDEVSVILIVELVAVNVRLVVVLVVQTVPVPLRVIVEFVIVKVRMLEFEDEIFPHVTA